MLKIKHFEFWNTHVFHLPVYVYWLYLSLKARSFFFFRAANPGIETGGLMGESKYEILQKIDPKYLPKARFYSSIPSIDTMLYDLEEAAITFPFILKPDIGQGGWMIERIADQEALATYLSKIKMPFIAQEYVEDPIEVGLLYYRFPHASKGTISSLAIKELLNVTGDGYSSVEMLVKNNSRAKTQWQRLLRTPGVDLHAIPAPGEKVCLSFIGNHSCGTQFHNGNNLIDDRLVSTFDTLCRKIDGFYFGRFDLRCQSIEDLRNGNFKILELNGVGSEPLHIFDPREKLLKAYQSAFQHWKVIYQISQRNRKSNVPYMRLREAWAIYKNIRRIQQLHSINFTIGN